MSDQESTHNILLYKTTLDFPAMLDLIALEQIPGGEFSFLSDCPDWAGAIFPEFQTGSERVKLTDDLTFLVNFIDDCEAIWQGPEDKTISSGPWVEVDDASQKYSLEAKGLLWRGRKVLLIERINESFNAQSAIVQRARENALLQLKLEHELEKKQRLELELIRARDTAEQANRDKSEFISTISHELRTPLSSILGFAQLSLLERETPMGEPHTEYLNQIISSGKHLLMLIDELLESSILESRNIALIIDDVNPSQAVRESLKLVQVLANERKITLVYEEISASVIQADFSKLKQIFINLLSNAIKYSPNESSVYITESIERNDTYRLTVTDKGIGIAEENLENLFRRYARLGQENSNIPGAGIGLAVVKKIVEEMFGQVGVESKEGVGSSFWIEFPLSILDTGLP